MLKNKCGVTRSDFFVFFWLVENPTFQKSSMASTEELEGIVACLTGVVKDLTHHVNHISTQIGQLATT